MDPQPQGPPHQVVYDLVPLNCENISPNNLPPPIIYVGQDILSTNSNMDQVFAAFKIVLDTIQPPIFSKNTFFCFTVCKTCNQKFENLYRLQCHKIEHTNFWNNLTQDQRQLLSTMLNKSIVGGEDNIKCPLDQQSCKNVQELELHIYSKHSEEQGEEGFMCDKCGMKFSVATALCYHKLCHFPFWGQLTSKQVQEWEQRVYFSVPNLLIFACPLSCYQYCNGEIVEMRFEGLKQLLLHLEERHK